LAITTDSITIIPEDPTKVLVYTMYDPTRDETINYMVDTLVDVWCSVTDTYGNPVVMDATADVTFTASKGTWPGGATTTIPFGGTTSGLVVYTPPEDYGTWAIISGKVDIPAPSVYEGSYSGNSPQLMTSCFSGAFVIDVTSDDDDALTPEVEVMAGKYAEICVTLAIAQEGVPVTFEITEDHYIGSFVPSIAYTDSTGECEIKFYVSTKAGNCSTVDVDVSKPITGTPTNVLTDTSDLVCTIAADPACLVVKTYEDIATTVKKSVTKPNGKLYLCVSLIDAYGNVAVNTFSADIQVNLSVDLGSLSVTTTYIWIWDSSTMWDIIYTAPSTTGVATITASSPQAGLCSDSVQVTIAGPEPVVVIEDPSADKTIQALATTTVTIAGYAEVSPAQPAGTTIVFFTYSLNGAANVSVPIVSTDPERFNFTVDLTVNATHTIIVYAEDSAGKIGLATRVITVEMGEPIPEYPAVISNAKTLSGDGVEKTSFSLGETLLVNAKVTNDGTTSQTMLIVAQVKDPDGRALAPSYITITLAAGQSIEPKLGFILPVSGYRTGTWTAKVMVLDDWPAVGGVVIGEPVELTFEVV
jgi:hypothetical protein